MDLGSEEVTPATMILLQPLVRALDIEILSNYCKGCSHSTKELQGTPEYRSWKESHKCSLNYAGSAGSMEPKGAEKILFKI